MEQRWHVAGILSTAPIMRENGDGCRDTRAVTLSCAVTPSLVTLTAAPGAGAPSRPPLPKGSREPGLAKWAVHPSHSASEWQPGAWALSSCATAADLHGQLPHFPDAQEPGLLGPLPQTPARGAALVPRLTSLKWTRRPQSRRQLEIGLGSVPSDSQSGERGSRVAI